LGASATEIEGESADFRLGLRLDCADFVGFSGAFCVDFGLFSAFLNHLPSHDDDPRQQTIISL
jgi:hypothetical protein